MSSKQIFISYRRSDTAGHAGRLYDFLTDEFSNERVFFDTNTIEPGVNFEQKLSSELEKSDVVLVLIGDQWLDSKGKDGNKRLDDPKDYVRFEVATALSNNKIVIPVLLQHAQMPSTSELPEDLHDLAKRNAVRVNDDHWKSDCKMLSSVLAKALSLPTSLKEKSLRRNKAWMAVTMIGIVVLANVYYINARSLEDNAPLLSLVELLLLLVMASLNVLLAAFVLRAMKKEFDSLSWIIIIAGTIGVLMSAMVVAITSFSIWVTIPTITMAALLNLVVPDT
jgi:hypothetical protein